MGLTLKSFREVLKGMADWTIQKSNRLVDFSEGSAIRTFYEAIAAEIEEFYYRTYKNFQWSVENSVYESFDFKRREALAAYGDLTITFNSPLAMDLTIPVGVRFSTSGANPLQFETKQAYTVASESTEATITVHCTVAGVVGNVGAETITTMLNPISDVSSIKNPNRFLTGKNLETLAARKARFAEFVNTRSKGTKRALEYGAMEIPEIVGAYADDSQIGIVTLYCHDQAGDLPSLVKIAVETNIENYRSAGIPVIVSSTIKLETDVAITLTLLASYNHPSFIQYVQDSISNYLDAFLAAEDFTRSSLNNYIRELDKQGIKNCIIQQPTEDVEVEKYQLIRSGTITVHVVEEAS